MSDVRDLEAEAKQIGFFRNVVPPELCAKWIDSIQQGHADVVKATNIVRNAEGAVELVGDRSHCHMEVIRCIHQDEVRQWVHRIAHEVIGPFYQAEITGYEEPQILRYKPGDNYGVHSDAENEEAKGVWRAVCDRQYSLVVFLNTDFTGGAFDFPNQNLLLEPTEPGLAISFPSDHRYIHSILPVEAGLRFTLVGFLRARKKA